MSHRQSVAAKIPEIHKKKSEFLINIGMQDAAIWQLDKKGTSVDKSDGGVL